MKNLIPGLDSTRLLIAVKTCLAIILAFAITLRLDWKPSFMAILMVTMQTAAFGATFKKTMLYILGTLSGAIAGVAMIGMFAHDRRLFILSMALLTGIGLYRLQKSREPYAWMIGLVTLALTGWLPAEQPSAAFDIAVMRVTTICFGVFLVYCVDGIIWPIRGGKTFERELLGFVDGCHHLHALVNSALGGEQPDVEALKKIETAQVKTIAALRTSLDAATIDTKRFKRFHGGYQQFIDQLHDLLLALLCVRNSIISSLGSTSPITGEDFRATMETIDGELKGLASDLARTRDGTAPDRDSTLGELETGKHGISDKVLGTMIAAQLNVLTRQVAKIRASLACVEDPRQAPTPPPPPKHEPFSLRSVQVQKAALGGSVIVLMDVLFIWTQWPMGLSLAMIFAMLAVCFSCLMPLMMISRSMLLSLVVGPAIAAVLYFGIMPRIDQYVELIPWLVVVFVPLLYWQTSPNPRSSLLAMFSSIFLIALLSLDEERQSYSFSSFFEMWLGLCGGFGISAFIFGLFSTVVPERQFLTQVRSFFAGCSQLMQALRKTPSDTPEGAKIITSGRKQRLGLVKQMQTWSSFINYNRFPSDNRPDAHAMIESIERAALWLDSSEYHSLHGRDTVPELLRDSIRRLDNICSESFQSIARALADLKPVPDLPDIEPLIHDLESKSSRLCGSNADDGAVQASVTRVMIATAHLRSLADAIHDCRAKANTFDWQEWNRNYL